VKYILIGNNNIFYDAGYYYLL